MIENDRILNQLLHDNAAAVDFIKRLFKVFHFWDDLIDKDRPLSDHEINDAMWSAVVDLPVNPFYQRFMPQLHPFVVNAIANWIAATKFERDDSADERCKQVAFVIRSDYANILIQCVYLIAGREEALNAAPYIREHWTHEDYGAFLKNLEVEAAARNSRSEV